MTTCLSTFNFYSSVLVHLWRKGVKYLSSILSCFGKGILRETEQNQEVQNRYCTVPNTWKLYCLSWLAGRQYPCIPVGTTFFPIHIWMTAAALRTMLYWCCEPDTDGTCSPLVAIVFCRLYWHSLLQDSWPLFLCVPETGHRERYHLVWQVTYVIPYEISEGEAQDANENLCHQIQTEFNSDYGLRGQKGAEPCGIAVWETDVVVFLYPACDLDSLCTAWSKIEWKQLYG